MQLAVYQRRAENSMTKRKGQTMVEKHSSEI
jgi:hypothetical protein